MSYGYTPYDKKSYKASKKRRKQALKNRDEYSAYPYRAAKRKLFVLTAVILAVVLAFGGILLSVIGSHSSENATSDEAVEIDSSALLEVVNTQSPLDRDYVPELLTVGNVKVNSLAAEPLKAMISEAKKQGIELNAVSAYVSFDEQQALYEQTLQTFLDNPDYTQVRAEAAASRITPKSGCSEAQTGLLVSFDLSDIRTAAFVERSCVNFGFVLRYTEDKSVFTGRVGDNSAYRFVGKENAIKMRAFEMCLEEYNNYLEAQRY